MGRLTTALVKLSKARARVLGGLAVAAVLGGGLPAVVATPASAQTNCSTAPNPIVCENALPGNPPEEWDINGLGDDTIQGFATDISVNVGSSIDFKVKTNATAYTIDIYRTGYYGGLGARKVASVSPSASLPQNQPTCATDSATNLMDCGNWAVSASWAVPSTAISGVYIAVLKRADTGGASHIIFVVRNDASTSPLFFQTSDTTWQAYNTWGDSSNFYYGPNGRATKLSYNRPFDTRASSKVDDFYFASEYAMVRFLERNGYHVSYTTGVDSSRRGNLIQNHDTFLSVGHDEYWSGQQRANVEAARDAGVNLAFFSGNEVYWRTRWEPSVAGSVVSDRTLVCYKETWDNAKTDPSQEWTGTWRDPRFSPPAIGGGRPENALTGTAYMVNNVDAPIEVPEADGKMRFWRNTPVASLAVGAKATLAPSTLGYESNEDLDNGFRPAGLFRLSTTTTAVPEYLLDYGSTTAPGTTTHHLTTYRAASGALVFSAGTIQWSWGLDVTHDEAPPGATENRSMQQATVNLLADMGAQPGTLMSGLVPATASTDSAAPTAVITSPTTGAEVNNASQITITGTATDTGGGVVAGVEVSTDSGATWHPATGRGTWSYTASVQGYGPVQIKARAVDDSGNLQSTPASVDVDVSCPCSLFGSNDVPATITTPGETQPVELGVKFTSSTEGWVSGVRFYKGPANTGTHIGSLWSANGTRLAQATFTGETASGWQTVTFSSPVEILADTVYVVSYFAPAGGYSSNASYFTTAKVATPLRAPANGEQGANGVFRYGTTSAFPSTGSTGTNYWVDPIFTTTGPPDNTPPTVLASEPVVDQTYVDQASPLRIAFSESMQAGSMSWDVQSPGGPVTGTATYDSSRRAATFTPTTALAANTAYTVTVSGGLDRAGNAMAPYTWSFTTWPAAPGTGNCPCTIFGSTAPATVSVNDPTEIELGVKFQPSVDGFVAGVRFYKGPSNAGPHTVTLWSAAGAELATTPVYFGSASGWQTAFFPTPVPVTAGTLYVASYHTVSGNYSATSAQFANAVTTGPLTAPASGNVGGNGVYAYGSRVFPTSSFNATSYGVDVVYQTPPDVTAPTVSFNPGAGATSVPVSAVVQATFSEVIVANSVSATLTGPGGAVPATVTVDNTSRIATITPASPLSAATAYTVSVTAAADAAGNQLAAPATATFTTAGLSTCPCTIFASDAIPPTPSTADPTPVEVGTRFTVDTNGWITNLRFYKGAGNTGTHTGHLWSSTGTLLSTATFTNETTTGWQTVELNPPVAVTAGTTYVASYWAPAGRYSSAPAFFVSPWVNGPFTAPAESNGGNGVFTTVEGNFPQLSFNATNYWVDAVFTTVAPPDALPPTVTTRTPVPGSTSVPPSTVVRAQFNEPIQPATASITVRNPANALVPGTTAYDSQTNTVTFSPTSALTSGTVYSVAVSGAVDLTGNAMTSASTWSFTTATAVSATCPCSIWADESVPLVAAATDTQAVELGVKFRTDTAGFVTGVRFYKGVGNGGTHTGHLWSSTGTLLATATFTTESTTGWQQVSFTPAVAVTANTTYIVSYHAPVGRYANDLDYFATTGVDSGSLHALRSGADGANGVYAYGPSGSFPVNGTTTNYWVDVVYDVTADLTPPTVTSWTPASNATNVALSAQVTAVLSEDVTPASASMTLRQTVSGATVAGTSTYNPGTRTITFAPTAALPAGTGFTASVTATDLAGNAINPAATSTFTTLDNTPPTITSVVATGSGTTATITWTTNEGSTSVVNYGTTAATLNLSATGAANVTLHSVTLTGLTPNTRYYYRVTSADPSGNSATSPASPAAPASYAPTVTPIVRTAVADFAGTNSSTLITNVSGGEVSLAPTIENNFDGTTLGTGWTTQTAQTGGTAALSGGQVTIDGTILRSSSTYGNTTAVEFTGVLGTVANRFVGFGNSTFAATGSPRYGFSTGNGNQLLAVSRGGLLNLFTNSTTLTASLATTSHVYRIERSAGSVVFKIDGTTVATHTNTTSSTSLNVGGIDPLTGGGGVSLNWMRVLPYAASGTWTSNVIDASAPVTWGAFSFTSAANGGTITVQTRTGNTAVPDATWTAFTTRTSGANLNVTARYIQYRITFAPPANRLASPIVDSVTLAYAIP